MERDEGLRSSITCSVQHAQTMPQPRPVIGNGFCGEWGEYPTNNRLSFFELYSEEEFVDMRDKHHTELVPMSDISGGLTDATPADTHESRNTFSYVYTYLYICIHMHISLYIIWVCIYIYIYIFK